MRSEHILYVTTQNQELQFEGYSVVLVTYKSN